MAIESLSRKALNRSLLARQMLLAREEVSALAAVERLVGMQAQQPQPPFVGLWTRMSRFEREDLLQSLRAREIVRVTMMRGTLHMMSAADYRTFRGTLQPMLTAGMNSILRERMAALDLAALLDAAKRHFGTRPSNFTALRGTLTETFPHGEERAMGYAVRTHLPVVAVPDDSSWGFPADPDFTLAETWLGALPDTRERPADLVLRYLGAFGPATAADFQAWSGVSGAKTIFETLRPRLHVVRDDRKRELFDLPDAPRPAEDMPAPVRYLPGFDNAILAHADRSRIIADEHRPRVTTKNLIVLPTFLVDGFVAGTWKCELSKKTALLTISPFTRLARAAKTELTHEAEALLQFLEPGADRWVVDFEAGR
jgi:hypothetical protein